MTSSKGPSHVVVDGSNIATEGRSLPSLAQLNEAVMAFMDEYPDTPITVVVDATFGHRIDKSEVKEFEEGISNNELVAPPAGAVGRGDAFVLAIAQKSKASILSNDSFQEFHGDYEWLFDEGRLIGGKPVPHVGWVFVDRVPVRGPVSRKATGSARGGSRRGARRDDDTVRTGRKASAAAMEPMPVPTSPPPGRRRAERPEVSAVESKPVADVSKPARAPRVGEVVNELMPFLEFVEHHPVGTSVNGTVESYSSHGAYITIGENGVRGYVPLRLMANPAPPSARKVMRIGESVTLVVVSFAPLRRSIDCAVPDMAEAAIAEARAEQAAEAAAERATSKLESPKRVATKKQSAKRSSMKSAPVDPVPDAVAAPTVIAPNDEPASSRPAKRTRASAPSKASAGTKPAAKQAGDATTTAVSKRAATKVAPERASSKPTPAKKTPATQASAAKKSPAKKSPAKKTPAKKSPAKQASATTTAPVKQAPATKAPAKKAPAKNASAKNAPAKKASAKKTPAKKAPSSRVASSATRTSSGADS